MRISDWSSDVCSSDLIGVHVQMKQPTIRATPIIGCCIPLRFRSEVTDQTNVQRFQLSMMIDIETGWAFRTKDEATAHLTAAIRWQATDITKIQFGKRFRNHSSYDRKSTSMNSSH